MSKLGDGIESSNNDHEAPVPLWYLSSKDDREARSKLKELAYRKCHEQVRAMADCAKANGLIMFPACTPQKKAMGDCLLFYQKDPSYLDAERDKLILRRIDELEQSVKEGKSRA